MVRKPTTPASFVDPRASRAVPRRLPAGGGGASSPSRYSGAPAPVPGALAIDFLGSCAAFRALGRTRRFVPVRALRGDQANHFKYVRRTNAPPILPWQVSLPPTAATNIRIC